MERDDGCKLSSKWLILRKTPPTNKTYLPVAPQTSSLPKNMTFLTFLHNSLKCSSRCTVMETSYCIQVPAHSSIVHLAWNVTCLCSVCKAGHCACEPCPELSAQRTRDWTQTVAIIASEFSKWSLWQGVSDKNGLVVLFPAGFVWCLPQSKSL